jgi:hypothetical protein
MRSLGSWSRVCMAIGMLFAGVAGLGSAENRDGVFIHITHGTDDPHRVLMALNMARMMSPNHPVLVYFYIRASRWSSRTPKTSCMRRSLHQSNNSRRFSSKE